MLDFLRSVQITPVYPTSEIQGHRVNPLDMPLTSDSNPNFHEVDPLYLNRPFLSISALTLLVRLSGL